MALTNKTQIFLHLSLSIALLIPVIATTTDNGIYNPSVSIFVNCGSSSDEVDVDGRKWVGDHSPNTSAAGFISTKSIPSTASFQDASLPSSIPYMTASIFESEATYKFSVSKKEHLLIRLHFYPSSYNGLSPEKAFFDVVATGGAAANSIILLHNFSAYITAQALTQGYMVREFYLPPINNDLLTLTFTPTVAVGDQKMFAFINGIEIISMPDIFSTTAIMVGFSDSSVLVGASALQTMYRLNVGGQYIPPNNDTGFSRIWYDDTPYIAGAGVGVTTAVGPHVKIQYPTNLPTYIAPPQVYSTARQMGPDPKVNIQYNLSWSFQIDVNFTYVVRLHFCELQLPQVNQRVFDIFINNQTAQKDVDIIALTSSMGIPIYKDYAIYISQAQDQEEQLLVELHPSTNSKPEFFDAILNGMEIFKQSDSGGNLAGQNPKLSAMDEDELQITTQKFQSDYSSEKSYVIGGGIAGGVVATAVLMIFAFCFVVSKRKRRYIDHKSGVSGPGWLPLGRNSHTIGSKTTISSKSCASSHLSTMAACLCRHFPIFEIKQATKNFDESLIIGVGGFGNVYKGIIDGGATKVAIKRANENSEQGLHEFQTEIEMLSKLRHKHLVSLIGYCEEDNVMCLIYDHMANGTLREHLYKTNKPALSWKKRLEICIGAARGLHYLHTGAKHTIIHRDVKTTNILLDDNFVAKVSDFGLSKSTPLMNQSHVSTVVKGSFGYLDPEYFRRQQLTIKSDVYSFGVVLFEVLCARPALNPALSKEQVSLADWAIHNQKKGTISDIVDPFLKGKIHLQSLSKFVEIAEKCVLDHGVDRPTMGDVLWNLEFALQLQESYENGEVISYGSGSSTDVLNLSSGGDGVVNEMGDELNDLNEMSVFSQFVNQKGR